MWTPHIIFYLWRCPLSGRSRTLSRLGLPQPLKESSFAAMPSFSSMNSPAISFLSPLPIISLARRFHPSVSSSSKVRADRNPLTPGAPRPSPPSINPPSRPRKVSNLFPSLSHTLVPTARGAKCRRPPLSVVEEPRCSRRRPRAPRTPCALIESTPASFEPLPTPSPLPTRCRSCSPPRMP